MRILLIFIWVMVVGGCTQVAFTAKDMPVVDTHVHFWDTNRKEPIAWPRREHKVLYRPFMPVDYGKVAQENNVKAVVIVQAGSFTNDNQWNLDVTQNEKGLYQGLVGNLSLEIGKGGFEGYFKRLVKDKRYVGFRLSSRPNRENFSNPMFWAHLNLVAKHGKTVDLLIGRGAGSYMLKDAIEIAKRVPELKIMVNHVLAIPITGKAVEQGDVDLAKALAAHGNVYCKVSGLFGKTTVRPSPKDVGYYAQNLNLVWELFGEDRLVFGSDWPVLIREGSYFDQKKIIFDHFKSKGRSVCEKLFYKNAIVFYGIEGF